MKINEKSNKIVYLAVAADIFPIKAKISREWNGKLILNI